MHFVRDNEVTGTIPKLNTSYKTMEMNGAVFVEFRDNDITEGRVITVFVVFEKLSYLLFTGREIVAVYFFRAKCEGAEIIKGVTQDKVTDSTPGTRQIIIQFRFTLQFLYDTGSVL